MPDLSRVPFRFDCAGVDLVNPIDRLPPGAFPVLTNARVVQEGRLDCRPGTSLYFPNPFAQTNVHSIRRVNDPATVRAALGYLYVLGTGTSVSYADLTTQTSDAITGFSGTPLSLIPFNPTNDPVSWMYVYDQYQQVKIRPDKVARAIGTPPPPSPPVTTYGAPAYVQITTGFSASGWVAYGTASSPSTFDRTNGLGATIAAIEYDSGSTGWCCLIPPFAGDYSWAGDRMQVVLNNGGGNQETVIVREIHPPITNTTIAAIKYDSGTSGPCSIVLTAFPANLARNSIIVTHSDEPIRVLSVTLSADGLTYSIRCSTSHTYAAGEAISGAISWYTYTTLTHVATETISLVTLSCSNSSAGTGAMALLSSINAANANNNRPISTSDDYLHLSLFLQNPQFVTDCNIMIDIDAGTTTVGSGGNAFTGNYWTYTVTAAQILALSGSSTGDTWIELVVPLASGVRSGNDLTRTFSVIKAIQVQLITTGACSFGFDDWYLFGTYGQVIQPNAPVSAGYFYTTAYRDSTTGSASVVGPQTRYSLNPLREQVIITPIALPNPSAPLTPAADSIDIYRLGGTLTDFHYDGTVVNNPSSPNSFADSQPDLNIAGNPEPDTTLLQPWPILDSPWTGVCSVVGTTVTFVSGSITGWNPALLNNSIIIINGIAYQTYGQPTATILQTVLSGGVQTNVPFQVASPTLAGQPLPLAFGPLEGPFAPVVFALGDKRNAGTLYFCNSSNLDAASDQNTLQICEPTNELVSGAVWNGLCFCGNNDDVYVVRYSYLQTLGVTSGGPVQYQFNRLPSPSGMWARWGCVRGPDGVYYIGRDGIYRMTDQGSVSVTDGQLYPMFPHEGQPAKTTNGYAPVDMTARTELRLAATDFNIYFTYKDVNGARHKLRYEVAKKRWFFEDYADVSSTAYLVELPDASSPGTPNAEQILFPSLSTGYVYIAGGNTDALATGTNPITATVKTPAFDSGDQRIHKLYEDFIVDTDQAGSVAVAVTYDDDTVTGTGTTLTSLASRSQLIVPIAQVTNPVVNLASYRNITLALTWSGGPDGPRVFAFEPSFYAQPYIMVRLATQFINLAFPGWKHHRRLYAGIISTADVLFSIVTQDDRTYGPYTIPATGGRYRIWPIMLDHGIKDLAFAYQLDGGGVPFAVFQDSFTLETKEWQEQTYIPLAVFKT